MFSFGNKIDCIWIFLVHPLSILTYKTCKGASTVVIVWYLDLQLPMQSEHITTNVMSSNPAQTQQYVICQWLTAGRWFSPGTSVSSTNKTDRHDITEILLKVVLNTINHENRHF